MLSMQSKIVVITGAAGALGRIVADRALTDGASVAAIDHGHNDIPATPQRLQIGGVDLSDASQATKAIGDVVAKLGRIDVLINIAGAFKFETVADGNNESWEAMHRLNLLTALNTSRAAIPHLVKSSAGRIVNIGAIGALEAGGGMGHRLTEALAAELKGKITVNAVLPSTIDTSANRRDMPNADFSKWVTPDELASVILFLASDAASAITGALVPVRGRV
jgi:NAD(P)-dependent dehydrogenase (short-subunit alcohol dehydrogenase family)